MHAFRWSMLLIAAALFTGHVATAQTPLSPQSRLSQGAACYSLRCFITLDSLDNGVAVTSNTGPGVAVHTPSSGQFWNVAQEITNPDYRVPPSPYSYQIFGGAAYRGSALLVGGTSPRYNFKDVVYVYAPSNGKWTHVQTLALQRPSDYDRTYLHRIATDGTTAVLSGTRAKDAANNEAFTQIDYYRRNANGTFSRRGGFKPPISPDFIWASSLVVDGNTILLSDPGADAEAGIVYVYGYDATRGWRLRTTLTADTRQPGAHYGERIAIDGNRIVIAAPQETATRPEVTGAVYIYEGSGKTWPLQQKLRPIDDPTAVGYQFGTDVDISGDRIVIGKYVNDFSEALPSQGYIYEKRGSWTPVAELTDPDQVNFNTGVRISGNIVMASATDWAYGRPISVYELPALGTLPAAATEE
jgi:hypothetical protein